MGELLTELNYLQRQRKRVGKKVSRLNCGPGSSVGIATDYGLDGSGIESRWGRDFQHLSRPALGPTQPPVQWILDLSWGVKSGQGVTLTPHPLLVPWSRNSTPPMGLTACTKPQCMYMGVIYLYI